MEKNGRRSKPLFSFLMAISFYILTESEGNNGHKKRK